MLAHSSAKNLAAIAAGSIILLIGACSPPPYIPFAGQDASDPNVRVAPAHYRSVTGTYIRQRPVEPTPWRQQNERVAPGAKQ
jgi:hypothetical protein